MEYEGTKLVVKYNEPPKFEKKSIGDAKTVTEAQREVQVIREADVIVVGGGPGGIAAAVSAARGGAKTILIERYGHLGGMASGGLVNIIPGLSNRHGEQLIGGFCHEIIQRLAARGGASFPEKQYWGTSEPALVEKYLKSNMKHFCLREIENGEHVILYTAVLDPEIAKDEMNTVVLEAGAELLLHTWVTAPIMEGDTVKGVIVESKSGRQALLAKVVIDSTGDGDLLPFTGTEIDEYMESGTRIAQLGWVYWICNVDLEKYEHFANTEPEKLKEIIDEIYRQKAYPIFFRGLLDNQEGVVWVHRLIGSLHQTDIEEMTHVDVTTRRQSVFSWELLKKMMPGFEKSFLMQTSPQLGTSGGRRIRGEYYMTKADFNAEAPFEDTIAIFAADGRGSDPPPKHDRTYVPYRALVPRVTEGLLVGCRAFSSDYEVQERYNLIPHCMCFGQAAGSAAAIAVRDNVSVRDIDFAKLREELLKHGAILP
ncbi:MAG: FAD-dependent oxidoreductase [Clostridiales bacterium]|nr:FAD-dependent oxidoreductase [Clostridiales bacterium]